MNSNRNRYASAPTYGMQKRTPVRKAAPRANKTPTAPVQPAPMQDQGYGQAPYGYPGNQPYMPGMPNGQPMPPQPMNGYPPYGSYPQEQQISYPTPSAGGNQTMGMPGYTPTSAPVVQPPMPNGAYPPPYGTMAYPPQQQQPAAPPAPKKKNDAWLPILLLAVLPVLFVVAMVVKQPPVYWVFIGFTLVGLVAMWLQSSFVSSARATLSLIYGALLVVSAVSLLSGTPATDRTNNPAQQQTAQTSSIQATTHVQQSSPADLLASLETMDNQQASESSVAVVTTPEPSAASSEAAIVLSNFMNLWNANKLDDMVSLCSPKWSSGETSAVKSLYMLLANRRPVDYTIEKITGTDADSSRTITMTSTIDRQNNKEPVKYRFQVLMLKDNETWYVDPQSLASNEKAESEAAANATPTPAPTEPPSSNTKLYYNPDGGTYYHAVNNCYRVSDKYLPLDPFYYKDLDNTKFKNLKPCPYCKAPSRP